MDRKIILSCSFWEYVVNMRNERNVLSQDRSEGDVTLELLAVSFEPERRENWAQDRVRRLVMI